MGLLDNLKAASAAATDPNAPAEGSGQTYAPAWRWEQPGDGVEGVVVHTDTRINDNNPDGYPIVTVRQADGTDLAIHGYTTVLKNEINERDIRPGDVFAAIYDGKKTSGSGRQFHSFRVAHEPGKGAPVPAPAAAPAATAVPAAPQDPWSTVGGNDIPPF
jgi:hypothetical protein